MNNKLQNKGSKIQWGEFLFYLFWGSLFAAKGLGLEEGHWLFSACILVALLCLFGKLCITKHSFKEWLIMAGMVCLGIAIWKSSGEKAALAAALVIIGMKNVPMDRLFKISLLIWGSTFAFSVTAGILHMRDGVVVVHQKLGLGPIIRWSLGYTHPNVLHVSYFVLTALILYICGFHGKKLLKLSGILMVGNVFTFLFSVSYTGVLLISGYLVLNFLLDSKEKLSKAEEILLQCVMPFCVLFPLLAPFLMEGKVFAFFNKLFSTRFELVYNLFRTNPIRFLGTKMAMAVEGHVSLDSSFAYLLMNYGIIAFCLFLVGYFLLIRSFVVNRKRRELSITLAIVIAGITEQFLFNLSFKNLSFFFLGEFLFCYTGKKEVGFWNQTHAIISLKKDYFCFPDFAEWMKCRIKKWEKQKWKGLTLVIGAAIAAIVICVRTISLPESVYVNRWLTDYRNEEEEVFLAQAPDDSHNMVLGYEGAEVGMYRFTGNIIKLEYIRDITGAAVIGMEAAVLLIFLVIMTAPKREDQKKL